MPRDRLVLAGLKAEAAVSGYHADNIAPALLGGFIIVRCRRKNRPSGTRTCVLRAHASVASLSAAHRLNSTWSFRISSSGFWHKEPKQDAER